MPATDGNNGAAGSGSGSGSGGSSDISNKFLSAFKESLKSLPFDPVCANTKPQSALISMMSTASAVGDKVDSSSSSSAAAETTEGATTTSRATGDGCSGVDGILNASRSPLSIIQSRSDSYMSNVWMPTFSSFTDQLEQAAAEYLTAISVGAALGAAVAAGIGMGCVAASGLVSGAKFVWPSFWYGVGKTRLWICQYVLRRDRPIESGGREPTDYNTGQEEETGRNALVNNTHGSITSQSYDAAHSTGRGQSTGEVMDTSSAHEHKDAKISCLGSGQHKLYVIRGDVRAASNNASSSGSNKNSSDEQCRQCLDDLICQLGKNLLGLQHVKRLTAYLVTGQCDASTFRSALKEYPISLDNVVLSIMYVTRLEQDHAAVQIEALASL